MKKILAMAAVAALAAGASAFAANPFSDVSTSDWAYQAVSDLSDRGLVEGYPDGTFRGQQNITRYELAQIVARLMAKEDQMNAEDRAMIDRLASEYAGELENLGVRVSNLEKKVGNIAWSGDARMRYQRTNGGSDAKDKFNGRIRINARATVNDTTYVHGRLVANGNFKDSDGGDVKMDRIYVHHQFGVVGATLGRYELDLGQQAGGWLYANAFDGVELAAPLGQKVNLAIGYGRMKDASSSEHVYLDTKLSGSYTDANGKTQKVQVPVKGDANVTSNFNKSEVFYAKLGADLKVVKLGVQYYKSSPHKYSYNGNVEVGDVKYSIADEVGSGQHSIWGVNLLVPVKGFRVFGDYFADGKENTYYGQKGKIWTVGLGYGKMDLKKAGSFNLDVAYFKVRGGLYEAGMTGLQIPSADWLFSEDGHFWLVTGDVAVAKNTYVHGEYGFGASPSRDAHTDDYANSWTLSLNYKF